MDGFLNFLADYYFIFIGLSVILLIALVGFVVGGKKKAKEAAVDPTVPVTADPNAVPGQAAPVVPGTVPAPGVAPVTPGVAPVAPAPVAQPTVDMNAMQQPAPEAVQPTLVIPDQAPAQPVAPAPVAPTPVAPAAVDMNAMQQPAPEAVQPTYVIPDPAAQVQPVAPTPVAPVTPVTAVDPNQAVAPVNTNIQQ